MGKTFWALFVSGLAAIEITLGRLSLLTQPLCSQHQGPGGKWHASNLFGTRRAFSALLAARLGRWYPEPRTALGFDTGLSLLESRCSPDLRSSKRAGAQPAEPVPQPVRDFCLLGA